MSDWVSLPPTATETTAALPGATSWSSALPGGGMFTLPDGTVADFPPELIAWFAGSGAVTVATFPIAVEDAIFAASGTLSVATSAIAPTNANFSGLGTASAEVAVTSALLVAGFTGDGALSAVVAVKFVRDAGFTGEGTATATIVEAIAVDAALHGVGTLAASAVEVEQGIAGFTGSGILTSTIVPIAAESATFLGAGTLSASAVAAFLRDAAFAGSGVLSAAVSIVTISALGMDKSGTQALNQNSTYVQITGWTPQSGTAAGDIVNNALVVNGSGAIKITAKATGSASFSQSITLQLRVNGNTVATSPTGTTTASVSYNYTATQGDVITLWGNAGSWAASYNWTVAAGNANTFVRYIIPDPNAVGMTKNASTQTINTSWTQVNGWVADASPSVVSNNALVVYATKTGAVITANIPWSSNPYSSSGIQCLIKVNGTTVATGATTSGNSSVATATATVDVTAGDLVTVEVKGTSTGYGPAVQAGADTWVRVE